MGTLLTETALVSESLAIRRAIAFCALKVTLPESGATLTWDAPASPPPRQPAWAAMLRPQWGGPGPEHGAPS
jgi:hypothetical protein